LHPLEGDLGFIPIPFDPVRVGLAVATFGLFTRDVDAAYLIIGGGVLGTAVFFFI